MEDGERDEESGPGDGATHGADGRAAVPMPSRIPVRQSVRVPARPSAGEEEGCICMQQSRAGQADDDDDDCKSRGRGETDEGRSVSSPTLFLPRSLTDSPSLMLYVV